MAIVQYLQYRRMQTQLGHDHNHTYAWVHWLCVQHRPGRCQIQARAACESLCMHVPKLQHASMPCHFAELHCRHFTEQHCRHGSVQAHENCSSPCLAIGTLFLLVRAFTSTYVIETNAKDADLIDHCVSHWHCLFLDTTDIAVATGTLRKQILLKSNDVINLIFRWPRFVAARGRVLPMLCVYIEADDTGAHMLKGFAGMVPI